MIRESMGAKYKPIAKKIIPVSTQDPESTILQYKEIQISELLDLPIVPTKMEDLNFTERLTKDRVSSIIGRVLVGFLTKLEIKLFIHIMLRYDKSIAFTDLEQGTFSQKYYPDYII